MINPTKMPQLKVFSTNDHLLSASCSFPREYFRLIKDPRQLERQAKYKLAEKLSNNLLEGKGSAFTKTTDHQFSNIIYTSSFYAFTEEEFNRIRQQFGVSDFFRYYDD
jgi:hypothetical protein